MMPPAALAKLRAIRDAMPTIRYGAERSGLVVLRSRGANEGAKQEPATRAPSREARGKRRVWPDVGGVRWAFEDARKKR